MRWPHACEPIALQAYALLLSEFRLVDVVQRREGTVLFGSTSRQGLARTQLLRTRISLASQPLVA